MKGRVITEEASLEVDEVYQYVAISVENYVERTKRLINNIVTQGPDKYEFENAYIQYALLNGRPVNVDSFWAAEGILKRNGERYGQLSLSFEASEIKSMLNTSNEKITFQSWNLTTIP